MNFLALRARNIVSYGYIRLHEIGSQPSISRRIYIYNITGPRYDFPYKKCSGYYLWEPEESGYFFCRGFLKENLVEYRSVGYHPVHIGDTMKGGRYQIVQNLGFGRDATVWLPEDRR